MLLAIFGVLMGVASAPTLVWYATTNPAILWQAGGATALFVAAFGTFGYLTQRDLSAWRRISFIGLLVLLVAGIVLIFVHIPHASLIWAVLGLVDLRRADGRRLPAAAPVAGAGLGAADRRVDLPGHPERLLLLPADLLRLPGLGSPEDGLIRGRSRRRGSFVEARGMEPIRPAPRGPARGDADLDGLLTLVGRGDQAAFEAVYDRVAAPVFGLIRRVLRDSAQSEEVAQETLLEVWRTAERFDPARGAGADLGA